MIGLLFLAYNLCVVLFTFYERYIGFNNFVDYYGYKSTHANVVDAYLQTYIVNLAVFAVFWVGFRFLLGLLTSNTFAEHSARELDVKKGHSLGIGIGLALLITNTALLYASYGKLAFERAEYHPEIDYGIYFILYSLVLMLSIFWLFYRGFVAQKSSPLWMFIFMLMIAVVSFSISTRMTGVLFVICSSYMFFDGKKYQSFFMGGGDYLSCSWRATLETYPSMVL
jgi:hypothetical protein